MNHTTKENQQEQVCMRNCHCHHTYHGLTYFACVKSCSHCEQPEWEKATEIVNQFRTHLIAEEKFVDEYEMGHLASILKIALSSHEHRIREELVEKLSQYKRDWHISYQIAEEYVEGYNYAIDEAISLIKKEGKK